MKAISPERKTPRAFRALLAALALAAFSPLLIAAFLVIYVRARYRGAGAKMRGEPVPALQKTDSIKTMSEIMIHLKAVPFRTRIPTFAATAACGLLEAVPAVLGSIRATAGLVYPYPAPFEPVMVESRDGTPICGLLAMQQDAAERPALIIVHGLFGSKNSQGMQALALRAYYEWGFHVFAMDLRNFGDSSRFSEAPTSWGYRESDDVLAVAEHLEATLRVSTVAACGVSMGAATVLIAAGMSRLDRPLAGGVVALNSYSDARRAVDHMSSISGFSLVALGTWLLFRILLAMKTFAGGPRFFTDLRRYTREVCAQYYELAEEDLYRKASPIKTAGGVEVPCLVIHSLDDPVVPVDEAYDLLAGAVDNPMVGSLIVPTGGHGLYHITSPGWFQTTLRTFFMYWAEFGKPAGEWAGSSGTDSMDTFGNPNN